MLSEAYAPVWTALIRPHAADFVGVLIEPAFLFCRVDILRVDASEFAAKAAQKRYEKHDAKCSSNKEPRIHGDLHVEQMIAYQGVSFATTLTARKKKAHAF